LAYESTEFSSAELSDLNGTSQSVLAHGDEVIEGQVRRALQESCPRLNGQIAPAAANAVHS
jgi:hypothetical protein